MAKLFVKDTEITVISIREKDYISLTDIAKAKNPGDANGVIANWLRNRNTIEFLGIWEQLYNSNFKPLEFEGFINEAGGNSFTLSPQKWIESTNAVGITSKSGRNGGTFAHKETLLPRQGLNMNNPECNSGTAAIPPLQPRRGLNNANAVRPLRGRGVMWFRLPRTAYGVMHIQPLTGLNRPNLGTFSPTPGTVSPCREILSPCLGKRSPCSGKPSP